MRTFLASLCSFWRDIRRFRGLWSRIPTDCRGALLTELLFNPVALRRRYNEEFKLQKALKDGWS